MDLSVVSQSILYFCIAFYGLFIPLELFVQIKMLKGQKVPKPDGSFDQIETYPEFFAYAIGNLFLLLPVMIASIILVLLSHRMGFYLMALVSFWMVFNYFCRTAVSFKVYTPKPSLKWIFVFPWYAIIGLIYIVWSVVHFGIIYPVSPVETLSLTARIILYIIMAVYAVVVVGLFDYQYKVVRRKVPVLPGAEPDDWHKYPMLYGGGLADVSINCPTVIIGLILILFNYWLGYYLVAMATSILIWCFGFIFFEIKFHKPKITFMWFVSFVLPPLTGLTFLIWTLVYFDAIY